MATITGFQAVADQGRQDELDPIKRQVFDELIRRGEITLGDPSPLPLGAPAIQEEPSAIESVLGAAEAGGTIATSIVAEPAAGLAGIITAPFIGSERASEVIDRTRDFFTFQPRTEAGKESLQSVGEFLAPVSEFISEGEKGFGDAVFKATGSPFLSAVATTIPTIASELVGVGLAKGVGKAGRFLKEREAVRTLKKAAPDPEQLFDVSRGIYNELDNLGVSIQPQAFTGLTARIKSQLIKNGIDRDITPKSSKALGRLEERLGDEITLTELDNLRSIAKGAANDVNSPQEALLGNIIIDTIDSFLDSSGERIFIKPPGLDVNISKRYKAARDLWGKGRKSELITEALVKAENQATGFENGIRTQFRSLLNNKRQRRFFTESEIKDMQKIVRGDKKANFFKLIGKLGLTFEKGKGIVGSAIGLSGGFLAGGATGAAAVSGLGSASQFISRIITEGRANLFNDLIRAGKNGLKITRAYLDNTPKGKRSSSELGALLIGEGVDLSKLPKSKFVNEAAEIAIENRRAISRGVVTTEIVRDPRLSLDLSLVEEENIQ